jgi:Kef-type K+ transport system membrane component KefB
MHYLDESMILIFLVQVSLLFGFSRIAGLLLRRIGQPAITGEILVGILLGPTLFGRMLPDREIAALIFALFKEPGKPDAPRSDRE